MKKKYNFHLKAADTTWRYYVFCLFKNNNDDKEPLVFGEIRIKTVC